MDDDDDNDMKGLEKEVGGQLICKVLELNLKFFPRKYGVHIMNFPTIKAALFYSC